MQMGAIEKLKSIERRLNGLSEELQAVILTVADTDSMEGLEAEEIVHGASTEELAQQTGTTVDSLQYSMLHNGMLYYDGDGNAVPTQKAWDLGFVFKENGVFKWSRAGVRYAMVMKTAVDLTNPEKISK